MPPPAPPRSDGALSSHETSQPHLVRTLIRAWVEHSPSHRHAGTART